MENFSNIAQLKDSGLKVTGPRLKILDLFETHAEEHLSAEDVYRILLEEGIEIGVATIYRVLTQFEQAAFCSVIILKPAKRFTNSTKATTTTISSA